jgi:hypothetical protein
MTHLERYARDVAILFHSGARDQHVPADDALTFREALTERFPDAVDRVHVLVEPDAGHLDVDDRFYGPAVDWLTAASSDEGVGKD